MNTKPMGRNQLATAINIPAMKRFRKREVCKMMKTAPNKSVMDGISESMVVLCPQLLG